MDQPSADPARLAESLADLAWLNRYLGGAATILQQLERLLTDFDRPQLRVLDVGAGGGDVLESVSRWCSQRGLEPCGVALDLVAGTVRIALTNVREWGRAGRIQVVRGNALKLPFSDRSFDVTYCNTFLHHLDPQAAVTCIREMARVSSSGVVVSDLRRDVFAYLSALVLARTLWRGHPYTRHDGPASVRAAYTLRDAKGLAERAGLDAAIEAHPGFRWTLRWKRT